MINELLTEINSKRQAIEWLRNDQPGFYTFAILMLNDLERLIKAIPEEAKAERRSQVCTLLSTDNTVACSHCGQRQGALRYKHDKYCRGCGYKILK